MDDDGHRCAVMVFSIFYFIFNDHFRFPNGPEGAFVHLRLPNYFKVELTVAKIFFGVLLFSYLTFGKLNPL